MQKPTVTIIGSNMTSLFLISMLERAGYKVSVIDFADGFGLDFFSRQSINPFTSDNLETRDALTKLTQYLGLEEIQVFSTSLSPLTVDDGLKKPFVGFGEIETKNLLPLTEPSQQQQIAFTTEFLDKFKTLAQSLNSKILKFSEISLKNVNNVKIKN